MKDAFGSRKRRDAQTLVFFLLAWGTIMLLCGLAIDSGLLYLAKARLSRAVDGAALVAVGNFSQTGTIANGETQEQANRDAIATIMRNFAAANFTDLSSIGASGGPAGGTVGTATGSNGSSVTSYTYSFNDGTQDANGAYRRYVQVILTTGTGSAITSATCNARCPVQTYFIGYAAYAINGRQNVKIGGYSGPSGLVDLKVSSQAVATRHPRLIMVVIDRSASMLEPGGGASGLPPAIVQFLDFFDTGSDNIGIVSFGSSARLEMPLTTNFIIAGTNNLTDAYETNGYSAQPGVDPEDNSSDPGFSTNGVRRLKFGGQTAADDGIRLAMEQLMANSGFNDPDVVKYMVVFTDGAWNATRTLFAAPGYTNELVCPPTFTTQEAKTNLFLTNSFAKAMTNGQYTGGPDGGGGPWSTNVINDTNLVAMPSMGLMTNHSSLPYLTNAIAYTIYSQSADFSQLVSDHTNDTWQSADKSGYEPLLNPNTSLNEGASMAVTNTTRLWTTSNTTGSKTNYYTRNVDVWLQPGSVAFYYTNGTGTPVAYVSDYTNPTKHINLYLNSGGKIDLVVPGYIADGIGFDGIDMPYSFPETSSYPRYRANNYQEAFMWPDDTAPITANEPSAGYVANSLQRELMFRNYPNLLTGFYIYRPDEPLQPYDPSMAAGQQGIEPLDDTTPPTQRPLYTLGAYYPSAGFYWPFDDVGVDYWPTYSLIDPLDDPDPNLSYGYFGGSRHIAYSINMLSPAAAPEWSGELFYKSVSGAGTNTISLNGTASASQIMVSSDWQNGAPDFTTPMDAVMASDSTHDTNISPHPSVWRPASFNGSNFSTSYSSVTPSGSSTGGYVSDGNGNYYYNTMAWSGRPTHYFDFSQSKWIPLADNHNTNTQFLQLGNWKAWEYAWHARALGVTIYTVGYGTKVSNDQCVFLAQIANATNTALVSGSSNISYNPGQPIGQQFYATNGTQISNDFYSVGQAINAALTGGN